MKMSVFIVLVGVAAVAIVVATDALTPHINVYTPVRHIRFMSFLLSIVLRLSSVGIQSDFVKPKIS